MAILIYRNLPMSIVHTREISRVVEMSRDGVDYLWTKWTFDVDVVVNPQATSYVKPVTSDGTASIVVNDNVTNIGVPRPSYAVSGNAPASPRVQTALPVVTDISIRAALSLPCGRLIYAPDSFEGPPLALLLSPRPGYATDANNGPVVQVNNITAVHGSKTYIVSLKIVTYVNEIWDVQRTSAPHVGYPVLLSHRFRQTHDMDEDYRLTVTTEGEAVFNAGELRRFGEQADQYRGYLIPACPRGFRRIVPPTATADSTDNIYRYRVVDREEFVTFSPLAAQQRAGQIAGAPANTVRIRPAGAAQIGFTTRAANLNNATRVEVYHKTLVSQPNWFLNMSPGALAGAAVNGDPGPNPNLRGRGIAPRAVSIGASMVSVAVSAFMTGAFPVATTTVLVRVWGHKASTRKDLEIIAVALGLARGGPPLPENSFTASIEHNCVGKFVEYQQTVVARLAPAQASTLRTGMPFDNILWAMPDSDDTPWPAAANVDPRPGGTGVPQAPVRPLAANQDTAILRDQGMRMANPTAVRQPPRSNGTRGWYAGAAQAPPPLATTPAPAIPSGVPAAPVATDLTPP